MLNIWKQLPEDMIEYVLSFAPNFRNKLKACQEEYLEKHRPCYFKKVVLGFTPGISDSPTWHNFKKHDTLRIWNRRQEGPMEYTVLELHAIEITPYRSPNDVYWHDRDIILYYGWTKPTNHHFWNIVLSWNIHAEQFAPGYY